MNKGIRTALLIYAREHRASGDFVMACLENNLIEAVTRADMFNFQDLPEIMRFIFNELPGNCWSSERAVARWLKLDGPTALPDLKPQTWKDHD